MKEIFLAVTCRKGLGCSTILNNGVIRAPSTTDWQVGTLFIDTVIEPFKVLEPRVFGVPRDRVENTAECMMILTTGTETLLQMSVWLQHGRVLRLSDAKWTGCILIWNLEAEISRGLPDVKSSFRLPFFRHTTNADEKG